MFHFSQEMKKIFIKGWVFEFLSDGDGDSKSKEAVAMAPSKAS